MKRVVLSTTAVLVLLGVGQADPPPFGTVLQQWPLQMSGSYAGSGVTWCRDEGMFYLMDQGYAGPCRVWKLDPEDPTGTITQVPWVFANLGDSTTDIPWAIAWDDSVGCFWMSSILDGSVYGGCYLLRYVWDGLSWIWLGDPGDSWCISDTTGGNRLLWVAGLDRNALTGHFWFSSVIGLPDTSVLFVALNLYTKTAVDTVYLEPSSRSGRGLALVPWDSVYFLTSGWSTDEFRKYDSSGRLLQAVSAPHGPSDWAVHYPLDVGPDDTVCVYCINSHPQNYFERISTGMTWRQLPTALGQNVSPSVLVAPVGVVDSGEAVVPRLVVRNHGVVPAETVSVHLLVDDEADVVMYHESTSVTLPPHATDTLEFPPWVPAGRDSVGLTAWTYWAPDILPEDDTLASRVLVRVKNVGITRVINPIPNDTIDPGLLHPQVQVFNHGNVTETFPLVFGVDHWRDTVMVVNLLAGGARIVTSHDSFPVVGDTLSWACTIQTELDGDLHPEDNDTVFPFWVRGMVEHDLELDIVAPAGSLLINDPFTPIVQATNNAVVNEEFWLYLTITDSQPAVVVYDSIPVMLPAGFQTHVAFPAQTFSLTGRYLAACSADIDPRNWTTDTQSFWVCYNLGVEGGAPVRFCLHPAEPNPFTDGVAIGFGLPEQSGADLAVYSADGRRVKGLTKCVLGAGYHRVAWDGRDDAGRAVSRGVYCLRLVVGDREVSRRVVKLE